MGGEYKSERESLRTSRHGQRNVFLRAMRSGLVLLALGAVGTVTVQCSSLSGNSGNGSGGFGNGSGQDASASGGSIALIDSGSQDHTYSRDAFFAEDPPPKNCGDGGGVPPVPGGTPQCPDDKNLQGCPCTQLNQKAACWPGYRRNRHHGNCHDGTTTCIQEGENRLAWGPCVGYTGIDKTTFEPLGTTGAAACTCFSHGEWTLANTEPCFSCNNNGCTVVNGATSSIMPSTSGGAVQCPSGTGIPSQPWSTDTVSADCTGYFKLCYTVKALSAPNAAQSSSDCVVQQVCTAAHYNVANQTQSFPDLSGWATTTPSEKACAQAFVTNGGYAVMSVDGQSDECDKVQKDFQTVTYCPLACSQPNPPASCAQCTPGGGGQF